MERYREAKTAAHLLALPSLPPFVRVCDRDYLSARHRLVVLITRAGFWVTRICFSEPFRAKPWLGTRLYDRRLQTYAPARGLRFGDQLRVCRGEFLLETLAPLAARFSGKAERCPVTADRFNV